MQAKELIEFEEEIATAFNNKEIRAPIHLHGNNENQLIKIFESISPSDWIFSSWRSHYHCLLKGVPPERLKRDILDGKSITLIYPEYKIYTSAIVGGIIPIALGTAIALKRMGSKDKVNLFMLVNLLITVAAVFIFRIAHNRRKKEISTF